MITDDDLDKALDRLARTPDGELLYRYLQKVLMGVLMAPDISESALRTNHGERSLAAKLMARMAKGIDESGGRHDTDPGRQRSERPVVFVTKQPVPVGGSRNFREWAREHDPELKRVKQPKPGDD